MSEVLEYPDRTYPCSYGCGNQIDVIITQVDDSSTLLLCFPCYVLTAQQVLEAMLNPDDPGVKAAIAGAGTVERARRGKAAPLNSKRPEDQSPDDPDYIAPFQGFDVEDDDDGYSERDPAVAPTVQHIAY